MPQQDLERSLSQDSEDLYGSLAVNSGMLWELAEADGTHPPHLDLGRPKGSSGLFLTATLADLPRRAPEDVWSRSKAQLAMEKNPSQPQGTSEMRAAQALRIKKQRIARTGKLNKYVPILAGKCIAHLLEECEITPEHFPTPCSNLETHGARYSAFRKQFVFQQYRYCFTCGLPQGDRADRKGEGPDCHRRYVPGSGQKYPFQYVLFKTTFIAGQKQDLLGGMCRDLGVPGSTFEEYLEWATSGVEAPGHYHNAIEAFLWCCEYLERKNTNLFL
ncbi:hypothetical protein JVT61DRAFT_9537 [Boletus reticuloceps]|uniref:Uncharacterized protein n=1 Tax=Boletus reticuloceps TaxID=495285 RepID=A0A8I3A528_9AGAM|nr:hypothetical protein JVT61DRAFT_9537 [Boletus reticuloceps]